MRQFGFYVETDAVGLPHDEKIVARFYKVQYEHMKRDVVGCAFVFVSNFLGYTCAKNCVTIVQSQSHEQLAG